MIWWWWLGNNSYVCCFRLLSLPLDLRKETCSRWLPFPVFNNHTSLCVDFKHQLRAAVVSLHQSFLQRYIWEQMISGHFGSWHHHKHRILQWTCDIEATRCFFCVSLWVRYTQESTPGLSQSQSQPLSFIIWASSMMYLPSLYFWLFSKACSYFHPSVVLQHSQKISDTACKPVSRTRSSAGPHAIFTTELNKYALPWLPWNDFDMRSSWLARWALQWMQL